MRDHHPPKPKPGDRKNFVFLNRNEYAVRINFFRFESSVFPRQWDTTDDGIVVQGDNAAYAIPIVGPGTVFLRYFDTSEKADTFTVQFDPVGEPYPYIFGGDRWTMALRHKALQAVAEHGG